MNLQNPSIIKRVGCKMFIKEKNVNIRNIVQEYMCFFTLSIKNAIKYLMTLRYGASLTPLLIMKRWLHYQMTTVPPVRISVSGSLAPEWAVPLRGGPASVWGQRPPPSVRSCSASSWPRSESESVTKWNQK